MMSYDAEDFLSDYNEEQVEVFSVIYESSKNIHDIICNYVSPLHSENEDLAEEFRIDLCARLRDLLTGNGTWQSARNISDTEEYTNMLIDIRIPFSDIISLYKNYSSQAFTSVFYALITYPCSGFPSYDCLPPLVLKM